METKVCRVFKSQLALNNFYKHPNTRDRLQTICKECNREWQKTYRITNPTVRERTREQRKARSIADPAVRERHNYRTQRWQKENPEKNRARAAVNYAIQRGKMTRQPCEVCGAPNSHGHHDDYSKPLVVRWLCPLHHKRHHHARHHAAHLRLAARDPCRA